MNEWTLPRGVENEDYSSLNPLPQPIRGGGLTGLNATALPTTRLGDAAHNSWTKSEVSSDEESLEANDGGARKSCMSGSITSLTDWIYLVELDLATECRTGATILHSA